LMRPMRLLDPLDLGMSIDETITDTSGTFRFTRLSAGVYYPNADCNAQGNSSYLPEKEVRGTPRPSTAWRRTL
jgi:hypothetical protein